MTHRTHVNRHESKRHNTRLRCDCGAYWFPHRKTGGACDHAAPGKRDYFRMLRQSMPEAVAMAELSESGLNRLYPL